MPGAIYVITYHEFNHGPSRPGQKQPLDPRFLNSSKNYIYYLIDREVPEVLKGKKTLLEHEIDPELYTAGGRSLGEWSFLLAEEKHAFCEYPFFMVSSRFYEKNTWLIQDLNHHWDKLFAHFDTYGWGYLPSYDRPLRWINLAWRHEVEKEAWKYKFFPFTPKTYKLVEQLYGTRIPEDYGATADLFCNYVGFRSREDLLAYVNFYRPVFDYFFNADYTPKRDVHDYIRPTGVFRNEKSFAFFLELLCHFFFFKNKKEYFALHYDGYYRINEASREMQRISPLHIPIATWLEKRLRWQWRRSKTEGALAPLRAAWHRWKS
jgi:hypothetical protein